MQFLVSNAPRGMHTVIFPRVGNLWTRRPPPPPLPRLGRFRTRVSEPRRSGRPVAPTAAVRGETRSSVPWLFSNDKRYRAARTRHRVRSISLFATWFFRRGPSSSGESPWRRTGFVDLFEAIGLDPPRAEVRLARTRGNRSTMIRACVRACARARTYTRRGRRGKEGGERKLIWPTSFSASTRDVAPTQFPPREFPSRSRIDRPRACVRACVRSWFSANANLRKSLEAAYSWNSQSPRDLRTETPWFALHEIIFLLFLT